MDKLHNVYIAFGTNMGNRRRMIEYALILCSDLIGRAVALSEIRSSMPVGYDSDHEYLNGVFHFETRLEPEDILARCMAIERELGRVRTPGAGYEDRPMDLDILFYDDAIISTENLEIPHPRMHQRRFTLEPMCDIAPDFVHPVLKRTMKELLDELNAN